MRILRAMRATALLLLVALAGCSTAPLASVAPLPSAGSPSTPSMTPAPSPTPVGSTLSLGRPDSNGVPTSVDGQPVLTGAALRSVVDASADATPFLAGGWFKPPFVTRYCALVQLEHAVDSCYTFYLFDARVGPPHVGIAPGDVPNAGQIAGAVERPVILQVHTHDPRCEGHGECLRRAVLDRIVWLGDAPVESAPPRVIGTLPPGGISRDEAVDRARAESYPHTTPLELRSARAVPLWSVLPDQEINLGDIWVWVVVFDGHFSSPCDDCQAFDHEEAFLEYADGDFIMARL